MAGIKKIIFRGHAILASFYVIAQVTFAWGADKSSYDAGIVPSPQTYSYTYDGNRIASVNGMQYSHDANGNVTEDGYHEAETSYNLLNLPCRVENPESTLYYSYIADGTKVAMTADDGRGYAYFGDVIFSRSAGGNYAFESFSYGDGRIEGPNNTVRHYVTDHLGNVRAVVTDGQVVERSDYYPFGGRHARSTLPVLTSNRWRLGAKESQPSLTGSLVDFGARMYEPLTGRWTTQDPMAWKYLGLSPYNYCGNDWINRVDIDGESWFYCLENGSFISHIPDEDDNVYMISSDQLKCGRSDSALRSYRDLDMLSNAFGQMAIEGKLSNSTAVGVISDLFSRANKTDIDSDNSYLNKQSIPRISVCTKPDQLLTTKQGIIYPKAISTRHQITAYVGNGGYFKGYDIINLLSHEIKHIIDFRKGVKHPAEKDADLFSINHWSFMYISENRKNEIFFHMRTNYSK